MEKFMKWINEKFGPALTKVTDNIFIASVSDGLMLALPILLAGTFVMIADLLKSIIPGIPSLVNIQNYSFGLFGLLAAFGIAYKFMERRNTHESKVAAGMMAIGTYFMLIIPTFNEEGLMVLDFSRLGASGIFVAVLVGLFARSIMSFFEKKQFFSKGNVFPQFVTIWFDIIAALAVLYLPLWFMTDLLKWDLFLAVSNVFAPLAVLGQSFWGFVLLGGIGTLLYSFGLSAWTLIAIWYPIMLSGIAENTELVAQGLPPVNIHTMEVFIGWLALGGMGMTFMLNIFFLISKSKKLKAIGRATLVPTLMNINEPMVFGAPIAWNPTLMIPFIINGFLIPAIAYPVFRMGLVTIPSQVFQLWFLPIGITTFMINKDWRGLVLLVVLLAVSGLVYYPFFRIYERQLIEKKKSE